MVAITSSFYTSVVGSLPNRHPSTWSFLQPSQFPYDLFSVNTVRLFSLTLERQHTLDTFAQRLSQVAYDQNKAKMPPTWNECKVLFHSLSRGLISGLSAASRLHLHNQFEAADQHESVLAAERIAACSSRPSIPASNAAGVWKRQGMEKVIGCAKHLCKSHRSICLILRLV